MGITSPEEFEQSNSMEMSDAQENSKFISG